MTKLGENRVCTKGKVWELHIHSNQCFSAYGELKNLSVGRYVTELLKVLDDYEDLDMISFTDHNRISFDVYKEFYSRNSRFVLLPGIEIDTCLEREGVAKHLVVYFDAIGNLDKLEQLASRVNRIMVDEHVKSDKPLFIHDLLNELVSLNVQFVLSPHAMKQGKRGFDSDLHSMEEDERRGEMKKYLDQFFCFWESSGSSQIQYAASFLKEMDCGDRASVVAFSDSKDFNTLKSCLDDPCQYFNALPNFNGLKLAGSELTRITCRQDVVDDQDLGNYIGEVVFNGQQIMLTPRLNAIIGGRGGGKSVLLDAIASSLGLTEGRLAKERADFVGSFEVSVTNMSGSCIDSGQFHYDYYNQSYISKLFEKNGPEFNTALEGYFSDAFELIEPIDENAIRRANEETFEQYLIPSQAQTPGNLVGFVEKFVVDNQDSLAIKIGRKRKVDPKLDGFDYDATISAINRALDSKIPQFLKDDEAVVEAIAQLCTVVCVQAQKKRVEYFEGDYLFNTFLACFNQKKAEKSETQRNRKGAMEAFCDIFADKSRGYERRISLINAFIDVSMDFETHFENYVYVNGERKKAFLFKRELDVEHPIDYMIRLFVEQISSKKVDVDGLCDRSNLWKYIEAFCFDADCYKQNYNADGLCDALGAYKLRYTPYLSIHYLQEDGSYGDISKTSPGTQTNILIEHIVHRDTKNPLLIDQPEDNVDNQTIYSKIKNWFMALKRSRQVIVVTHDANIVINADADNVILARQLTSGAFSYESGALEYGDMLENASLILDGGKEAVKRRLVKYGE